MRLRLPLQPFAEVYVLCCVECRRQSESRPRGCRVWFAIGRIAVYVCIPWVFDISVKQLRLKWYQVGHILFYDARNQEPKIQVSFLYKLTSNMTLLTKVYVYWPVAFLAAHVWSVGFPMEYSVGVYEMVYEVIFVSSTEWHRLVDWLSGVCLSLSGN
jgi:hypothetical protein